MDGKKIKETIEAFQDQIEWIKAITDAESEELCEGCIEYFETAIEALEKQLPKKKRNPGGEMMREEKRVGNITIGVNLTVDRDTVNACLSLIELYLNSNETSKLEIYCSEPGNWDVQIIDAYVGAGSEVEHE